MSQLGGAQGKTKPVSATVTPKPAASAKTPTAKAGAPTIPAKTTSSSVASSTMPTGTQLATAFDGRLEPARTSFLYRIALLFVFLAMVLLPVVYLGIIVATGAGVWWYAVHAKSMFAVVRPGRAMLFIAVAYIAPLIAGVLLVIFMILPLFWRSRKSGRPMWVDRREQPMLFAYVDKLCDTMRVPRPVRIDVVADANASAHIDNGMLGLINRRLVLTIGLPLAQPMSLRQFTGVLAHELGHFSQGISMRLSYAIHRINRWFFRLAYTRTGVDDAVDAIIGNEPHWTIALIGLLSKIVLGIARLVLKVLALLSHCLCMQLSRQAEFDADRQAARIVGGEAMAQSLEATPFLGAASDLAVQSARSGWKKRALPDDLVIMTHTFNRSMPSEIKDKITAHILGEEASWFDTHPPLFKRIAALKKSRVVGVLKLDAPSTCLFRDFDELCKMATISLYETALGEALQPEHLVPTKVD